MDVICELHTTGQLAEFLKLRDGRIVMTAWNDVVVAEILNTGGISTMFSRKRARDTYETTEAPSSAEVASALRGAMNDGSIASVSIVSVQPISTVLRARLAVLLATHVTPSPSAALVCIDVVLPYQRVLLRAAATARGDHTNYTIAAVDPRAASLRSVGDLLSLIAARPATAVKDLAAPAVAINLQCVNRHERGASAETHEMRPYQRDCLSWMLRREGWRPEEQREMLDLQVCVADAATPTSILQRHADILTAFSTQFQVVSPTLLSPVGHPLWRRAPVDVENCAVVASPAAEGVPDVSCTYYCNYFTGALLRMPCDDSTNRVPKAGENVAPNDVVWPSVMSGGLLVSEMGLGKTVSVLALVTTHPLGPSPVPPLHSVQHAPSVVGTSDVSVSDSHMSGLPRAISNVPRGQLAREIQRLWPPPATTTSRSESPSLCRFTSRSTLVIVPPSLMAQWLAQCAQWTPRMSVYEYRGMEVILQMSRDAYARSSRTVRRHSRDHVCPPAAAEHEEDRFFPDEVAASTAALLVADLVVTSYAVLAADANFCGPSPHSLRSGTATSYPSPPSLLSTILFWRVIFDEIQVIENANVSDVVLKREKV